MYQAATFVAVVCYITAVAEARCGFNASMVCFKPPSGSSQQQQPAPRSGSFFETGIPLALIFKSFESDIRVSVCNRMDTMKICVNDATKDCDSDNDNPIKRFWDRSLVAINILCVKKLDVFNNHRKCLAGVQVKTAMRPCFEMLDSDHYPTNRRRRHTCDDYYKSMKCTHNVVHSKCGQDVASDLDSLLRIVMTNNAHLINCKDDIDYTSGASNHVPVLVLFGLLGYIVHVIHG